MIDYETYWNNCWIKEDTEELSEYLSKYITYQSEEIDIFKQYNIETVCDAACGFGAYSVALSSQGFTVYSFDVSEESVSLTKMGLDKYGYQSDRVQKASIINTGYEDSFFDGIVAHAVIDHLVEKDARKAVEEMNRIVRTDGLILLSFDIPDDDDYQEKHEILTDGTMLYTDQSRKGMYFRPYNWQMIQSLLDGYRLIYKKEKQRERVVIIQAS